MGERLNLLASVLTKATVTAGLPGLMMCGVVLAACDESSRPASPCVEGASCATPGGDGQEVLSDDSRPGDSVGDASAAVTPTEDLPCDVQSIVRSRCGLCHGSVPSYGAPMSLVSQADFAMKAPKVKERIHAATPSRRMPPVGQPELTQAELSALDSWLSQGTPARAGSCDNDAPVNDPGTTPPEPTRDGSLTCFPLLAHASGDKNAPYKVGVATDSYVNFTFMAPWTGTLYAHELHTIIDNPKVVHHWLLYKDATPGVDGAVAASSGAHPSAELMFGWAPGGSDVYFDALDESGDVGMRLEGGVSYTVELHYNSKDASAVDHSGVEVCGRAEEPANVASNAWLGTQLVFGNSAQGVCDPTSEKPIHIVGIMPHMHTKGTRMRAMITRANGSSEVLHDAPFDFNYQTLYPKDVWIMPGDRITTTCTYSGFATYGERTTDEMCYLFTLHTPGGSLVDGKPVGAASHGANACLGL